MPVGNDVLEKLFDKARQAIAARDWNKARQIYLQALGIRPNVSDVHYGLATVFFQLRDLQSAEHHFKEVTRLDPLRAGAFINLGAVQNLLHEYKGAVMSLRRGLQLDSSRVEGYYNLGVVYRNLGEDDLAMQAYQHALQCNPRMFDAHLNLANLLMVRGNAQQALRHYEKALQLRPNWPKALEGITQAEAALRAETTSIDPNATVRPDAHGAMLVDLNRTVLNAEEHSRTLNLILDREVQPAIQALATCLLQPNGVKTEMDECLAKFDAALEHMRSTYQLIQERLTNLKKIEKDFPRQ